MAIEEVLRPILDTVLDAVVVMDRSGLIREWNARAEETFGWSAEEAIGQNLEIIIPPALREAHRQGLDRFNSSGVGKVLNRRLELGGLRKDGQEFPLELSITLISQPGVDLFVGFMRDISDRREAEERLAFQLRKSQLMLELSELGSRSGTLEEALVASLDAVCELARWPVGHAFLVSDEGGLHSSVWSSGARDQAPELVGGTEAMRFESGVGLPGRVLASGDPLWISRVRSDDNFPRHGLGFESAFAFPVFSGERCIAILEFFSRDPREPEPGLLLSARAIGTQVGRVFERRRAEELRALLVAELDHRTKNILSVIRGIAHLSFRDAATVEQARQAFDKRLEAVADANAILKGESGSSALVGEVVRKALAGCGSGEERVRVSGPDLCIEASAAIMLSLAVHELCTNAFKYGALGSDGGTVEVGWRICPDNSDRFDFTWTERGGPPVEAPTRKGFGMRILRRGMESATGGKARIHYDRDGFRYALVGARHQGQPGKRARAA